MPATGRFKFRADNSEELQVIGQQQGWRLNRGASPLVRRVAVPAVLAATVGLAACGNEPDTLAFSDEATVLRVDSTIVEVEDLPPPGDELLAMAANPDELCESSTWTTAAEAVVTVVADGGAAELTATGRGCRAEAEAGGQQVELRLEVIDPSTLDDVVEARDAVDNNDDGDPLMGFEELGFDAVEGRVTSSLAHPDLDRLEEHRWIAAGDSAFHLVVAVEPGGEALRDDLLDLMVGIEADLSSVVADHTATTPAADNHSVVGALGFVMTSVIDGVPLDEESATVEGLDAIAFEYTFPENIAGIAPYRDDAQCDERELSAVCRIDALDSTYEFFFISIDGAWLLDDFRVTT